MTVEIAKTFVRAFFIFIWAFFVVIWETFYSFILKGGFMTALIKAFYSMNTDHETEITVTTTPPAPISPVAPSSTSTAPSTPKKDMLSVFCHAIEANEGGPNDASHKNCNPGNFRCSPVGYLPKYGNVKCSPGGFAVFPTYQLGWEYLVASIHYRAVRHPEWTILEFFANYAPKADGNDPVVYANFVAKWCGVINTTQLKDLFA